MTQEQIEKLIQSIQAFSKCPTCDSQYEANEIKLVEETANTCLLEMRCKKCRSKAIGTVLVHEPSLNPSFNKQKIEPKKKVSKKQLKNDDIIKFNNFLKDFDGNFNKILNSHK
ncbi:hypothetical protein ACFLZS_01080 [Patescibacteria group bacterium]